MERYNTVGGESSFETIEKRSRFLGLLCPVKNESDAAEILKRIKKEHYNARHNVFAFRLLDGTERQSDDGEPQGTGGIPLLNLIKGRELYDVIAVVTRYFGGTLLGTGGLMRAYSAAAKGAIDSANIVKMELCRFYEVICDYADLGPIKGAIEKKGGHISSIEYLEKVTMRFYAKKQAAKAIEDEIVAATLSRARADFTGEEFVAL
jgi:uncharacterized YigZ family protein